MTLAEKINKYLTPVRRQALYQILAVIGVVLTASSPSMSTSVSLWTSVILAVATVGSLILAAIVTKAPQWPAIYGGLAALVAALVSASVITQGVADMALRIVQAAITVLPLLVILARTDVSTPDGSPAVEVPQVQEAPAANPPSATVTVINGVTKYDPANGNPPTITP